MDIDRNVSIKKSATVMEAEIKLLKKQNVGIFPHNNNEL